MTNPALRMIKTATGTKIVFDAPVYSVEDVERVVAINNTRLIDLPMIVTPVMGVNTTIPTR